jgi:hypothetical protein
MARTCILHFGFPKTGTTTLQGALSRMNDPDFAYAKLWDENHSVPLILRFTGDQARCKGYPGAENAGFFRSALMKAAIRVAFARAVRGSAPNLILSAESLLFALREDELVRLRDVLLRHFDDLRLIGYLRPYHALAPSTWQQRVRRGVAKIALNPPMYRKVLTPALRVFGRARFDFHLFDKAALKNGDIVDDFAGRIGITTPLPRGPRDFASLSAEAAAILFAHNLAVGQGAEPMAEAKDRAHIVRRLDGFGSRRIAFAPVLTDAALDRHRAQIAFAEALTGFDLVGKPEANAEPIESIAHLLAIARDNLDAAAERLGNGPDAQRILNRVRRGLHQA